MPRDHECPKCGGTLEFQDDDQECGIVGGWSCQHTEPYEPMDYDE